MRKLLGQPVFDVSGREFVWDDVLVAAALWKEWPPVARRALAGLRVLAANGGSQPAEEEVEAAAAEFRYARDLVSAEEMEAWLDRWGLDVDTWMAWVRADLQLAAAEEDGGGGGDEVEADAAGEDGPDEPTIPFEQAALAEALFAGALKRCAHRLAGRAAIASARGRLRDAASVSDPDGLAARVRDLEAVGIARASGLERGRALAALEEVFLCFRAELLTEPAIAARVRSHHADWTRVAFRALTLENEEAAHEAYLALKDDGLTIEEVARDAQVEADAGRAFLCDVEEGLRAHLVAARKGELVGPIAVEGGWRVCQVLDKRFPTVEDDDVRQRAEHSLLVATLSREVDERVTWRWTL